MSSVLEVSNRLKSTIQLGDLNKYINGIQLEYIDFSKMNKNTLTIHINIDFNSDNTNSFFNTFNVDFTNIFYSNKYFYIVNENPVLNNPDNNDLFYYFRILDVRKLSNNKYSITAYYLNNNLKNKKTSLNIILGSKFNFVVDINLSKFFDYFLNIPNNIRITNITNNSFDVYFLEKSVFNLSQSYNLYLQKYIDFINGINEYNVYNIDNSVNMMEKKIIVDGLSPNTIYVFYVVANLKDGFSFKTDSLCVKTLR